MQGCSTLLLLPIVADRGRAPQTPNLLLACPVLHGAPCIQIFGPRQPSKTVTQVVSTTGYVRSTTTTREVVWSFLALCAAIPSMFLVDLFLFVMLVVTSLPLASGCSAPGVSALCCEHVCLEMWDLGTDLAAL